MLVLLSPGRDRMWHGEKKPAGVVTAWQRIERHISVCRCLAVNWNKSIISHQLLVVVVFVSVPPFFRLFFFTLCVLVDFHCIQLPPPYQKSIQRLQSSVSSVLRGTCLLGRAVRSVSLTLSLSKAAVTRPAPHAFRYRRRLNSNFVSLSLSLSPHRSCHNFSCMVWEDGAFSRHCHLTYCSPIVEKRNKNPFIY